MSHGDDSPFVERTVRNLAAALGRDVFDLTPLGETVDIERLGRFFERSDLPAASIVVEFRYEDYHVAVDGDAEVTLSAVPGE